MKKLSIIAFVLFSFTACSKPTSSVQQIDFINAKSMTLPSDKWLVINYFAVWCKPCIKEIPDLNQLANTLGSKGLRVIGVDFDQPDVATMQEHIKQLDIQFAVSTTALNQVFKYPLPTALPTTLIINPNGEIVAQLAGPQTYQQLLQQLNKHGFMNADNPSQKPSAHSDAADPNS